MYLLEETEEAQAMRENVIRLLESEDVANTYLAFQLIEAGGWHESFEKANLSHFAQSKMLHDYFGEAYSAERSYEFSFLKLANFGAFKYKKMLSMPIDIFEYELFLSHFKNAVPMIRAFFMTTCVQTINLTCKIPKCSQRDIVEASRGYREFLAYTLEKPFTFNVLLHTNVIKFCR